MTTDRTTANKNLVEAFIQDLFSRGDLDAVDRYLAPDFVNLNPPRSRQLILESDT